MNPTLGFRAWAFKPRGSSVDSGRKDHLHFHLDREVMFVLQMSTNGEEFCFGFNLILRNTTFSKTYLKKFPRYDPKYVVLVIVDEPKGNKDSFGYATGGWVAAPAVKRIVSRSAPLLGVYPKNELSPKIRQILKN